MKISLRWLCDHIRVDWQKINNDELVAKFNKIVAEIEYVEHIKCNISSWFVGQISDEQQSKIFIPELATSVILPARQQLNKNAYYLVKKEAEYWFWVTQKDVGSSKEGFLPAFSLPEGDIKGAWRNSFESHDYVIQVDNKSINHRPDLWGHRGIAREVAAFLSLDMIPVEQLLATHKVIAGKDKTSNSSIAVENKDQQDCYYFSAVSLRNITNKDSLLVPLVRLLRADFKCIDMLVDTTNYVLADLGQPMHAFDAAMISDRSLIIRKAYDQEKLSLLDNTDVILSSHDVVVADHHHALSLAGIIGGKQSAITKNTHEIILESACFNAATIRTTAARVKKRTESSARFEKSLDPYLAVQGILRYLKLLKNYDQRYEIDAAIIAVGTLPEVTTIKISSSFITSKLGLSIDPQYIINLLHRLNFIVVYENDEFTITIPTFRATKDIAIAEDVVEEIARFYGFENLPLQMPERQAQSFDIDPALNIRYIKRYMAYALQLKEVYTYAFFDESFLTELNWQPTHTLELKEPASDNFKRLVTTLIPNLLKLVRQNNESEKSGFFEIASIWPESDDGENKEQESLAGIIADTKKEIDFYQIKSQLMHFFALGEMKVQWQKVDSVYPWYDPYQTAYLTYEGQRVGIAGKINPSFYQKIIPGDAFIFELDAAMIKHHKMTTHAFKPFSKYPRVNRDVSIMVSPSISAQQIINDLYKADARIIEVTLVDFFTKSDWVDKKAMTFRLIIEDMNKTLLSSEVDAIMNQVNKQLIAVGAQIR